MSNRENIDWQGYLSNCDFNQQLGLKLTNDYGQPLHVRDLLQHKPSAQTITAAEHCYACAAGSDKQRAINIDSSPLKRANNQ